MGTGVTVPFPGHSCLSPFGVLNRPFSKSLPCYHSCNFPAPNMKRLLVALTVIACTSANPAAGQDLEDPAIAPITNFEVVRAEKVYHAVRTSDEIRIDGVIDETGWEAADWVGDFYQDDPVRGAPATEDTRFRILYDDDNVYIAFILEQAGPTIVSEMKRDFAARNGDVIALLIDTFDDDRNGFAFQTNPSGAKRDHQIAAGVRSPDWNGVYDVATSIEDFGWTAEFAIPFRTLRFDDTKPVQRWGLNILRVIRYSNERLLWVPGPRPFGFWDIFLGGAIDGIEGVKPGRNLYVKPFAVSSFRPDDEAGRSQTDVGLDLKYGVTADLTLDLTVNTDFSQVEVDTQQVNLTRFNLFFPEKREFFLENAGLFDVGGNTGTFLGAGGGARSRDLVPFFSRRIGLSDSGQPLPIRAGARLTGKLGGFDVGAMNIQVGREGETPADNWNILRLRREILTNSDVGTFLFNRQTLDTGDWNRSTGADANFRFLGQRLTFSGFGMKTYTPGDDTGNFAGRVGASFQDNLFTARTSFVTIEDGFHNDFGFTPRESIRKTDFLTGVRPRPSRGPIRQIFPQFESSYVTDQSNELLTREHRVGVSIDFHAGDTMSFNRNMRFERLKESFDIRSGIEVPVGDHSFNDWEARVQTSGGRRFAFTASAKRGDFWTGTLRQNRLGMNFRHGIHFSSQLTWSRNKVELVAGTFKTDLVALRANVAISPRVVFENFVQYNSESKTISSNFRFRFIHRPLSDFFVVYTELRGVGGNDRLIRSLTVKFTRLLSF